MTHTQEGLLLLDERLLTPVQLVSVDPKPVQWLWPGTIPIGKVTIIAGDPGRGKSLITLDLAARVTRGFPWPCGVHNNLDPGSVLLFSAEDDAADTIRPRLDAAQADTAAVFTARSKGLTQGFQLPRDIPELEHLIQSLHTERKLRLVVFDPLAAYLGAGFATNQGLRSLVSKLQEMGENYGFAVVFITHLTKSPAASPIYRAMGSVGMVAAARAVHVCWPDEEAPGRCLFVPLKCNLAHTINAFAYSIVTVPPDLVPCIEWEPQPVLLSLVGTSTANPIPRVEDARCAAWLRGILSEGPQSVSYVERASRQAGFSRNALRRAKKSLGATSTPSEAGGEWQLHLPTGGDLEKGEPLG